MHICFLQGDKCHNRTVHGSKSSKQGTGTIHPSFPGKWRKEAMKERLYLDEA